MTKDSVTNYLRALPPLELMGILREVFTMYGVAPMGGAFPALPEIDPTLHEPAVLDNGERTVDLQAFGPDKIQVIKILRTRCPWMGLAEAKALVERAPVEVPPPPGAQEWLRSDALKLAHELRAAGALVQVR